MSKQNVNKFQPLKNDREQDQLKPDRREKTTKLLLTPCNYLTMKFETIEGSINDSKPDWLKARSFLQ